MPKLDKARMVPVGRRAYDPFLTLALQVIKQAAYDRDREFFESDDYDFWLGYVQVCMPREVIGRPMPARLTRRR